MVTLTHTCDYEIHQKYWRSGNNMATPPTTFRLAQQPNYHPFYIELTDIPMSTNILAHLLQDWHYWWFNLLQEKDNHQWECYCRKSPH
jgi:hypothetical protein